MSIRAGMDVVVNEALEFSVIEINRYPGTHKHNPVQVEIGRHSVRNMVQHALDTHRSAATPPPPTAVFPTVTSLFWRSVFVENVTASRVLRVGWKRAPADISCPPGWTLPLTTSVGKITTAVEINSIDVERGARLPPFTCTGVGDEGELIATNLTRIITQDQTAVPETASTGVLFSTDVNVLPCGAGEWANGRCRVPACNLMYRLHVCVRQ